MGQRLEVNIKFSRAHHHILKAKLQISTFSKFRYGVQLNREFYLPSHFDFETRVQESLHIQTKVYC